jgi:CubicO group peptidase (beta-lactamase class C family)
MRDLYWKLDVSLCDAVASFANEPLDFEPGARWRYSSMGIGTLGRIIEVVSGQPYETFITNRLLKPLAMNDSFFFLPVASQNRLAALYAEGTNGRLRKLGGSDSSYLLGGDPATMRHGAKYPAPEFGLYSTASDMARFYQMFLNGGAYLGRLYKSAASVSMMTAVQTGNLKAGFLPGAGYGLTWEVIQDSPTIPTPLSPAATVTAEFMAPTGGSTPTMASSAYSLSRLQALRRLRLSLRYFKRYKKHVSNDEGTVQTRDLYRFSESGRFS